MGGGGWVGGWGLGISPANHESDKVTNQSLSLEKPLTSSYSSTHKSFEDRLELTVACPEGGIQASVDSNAMTMSTWTQPKLAGFISLPSP